MKTVTVYSSRNNSDGLQPENKMFWNTYVQENEDFSSQLKLMEAAHLELYRDIVTAKNRIPSVEHTAFIRLQQILESIYENNGCVILEMFLYSAKAVPNLLPSDNVDRIHTGRDLTNAYARMLAKLMDRSIREYPEKKSNIGNPSINGYIHVLKNWPRTGTWNEIQRLAIRIYGEMKETNDEIEDLLIDALGKIYNYNSAFETLLRAEARNHSEVRLKALLKFICTKYNSQSGIRCTESMCKRFGNVIEQLYEDDSSLYNKLRDSYQEAKAKGTSVRYLNDIFELTEEDPLKDVYHKNQEEITKYIETHYDPTSFSWRRWLENLDNNCFWDAVKNRFENVIYPSGNINNISFMLCSFAGMHKLEYGRNYVKGLYRNPEMFESSALKCILLCARQLSGESTEMTSILELYEQLEAEELPAVQKTVRLLIGREKNLLETQRHIQEYINQTDNSEEGSIINMLNWICKYYQFRYDRYLSQSIIPTKQIMVIIERACGYEPDNRTFSFSPPTALLSVSMNYIANDITWENKKIYEGFLLAACKTPLRNRAEKLLVEHFSSDING